VDRRRHVIAFPGNRKRVPRQRHCCARIVASTTRTEGRQLARTQLEEEKKKSHPNSGKEED